jgi:divalent metal cation (Fe/Co/Zn/Cd) transporter
VTTVDSPPGSDRRAVLRRRVRRLVAVTITYNVVEAVVAIGAGVGASSVALVGFGLDSTIEVASAAAIAWQFSATDHEARERTALRIIAVSFFALAAYVTIEAVRALAGGSEVEHSSIGLGLAALSLLVMPVLSWAQRQAGRQLGSVSAVADSKQTLLCTYLSAVLLISLGLNSALGWWWADPLAALVIAALAVREGREAWRGDTCCTVADIAPTASSSCDEDGCGQHHDQVHARAIDLAANFTGGGRVDGPSGRSLGGDRGRSDPQR